MYKVLIADDEEIIRTELEKAFRWQDFDMEVVGVAKNGLEALEMVKRFHPDVCLLDVKMPFLNGLELIEKINEEDSSVVKIIISGYDEFEFAQKAIRLGVYNYVLKPIDENEFRKMMGEIRDRLHANAKMDQQRKLRNSLLERNRELLQAETLYKWIHGESSPESAEESLMDFGIRFSGRYDLFYVRMHFHITALGDEEYMERSIRECRGIFRDICSASAEFYAVKTSLDSLFVIASREGDRQSGALLNRELSGMGNWKADVYHRVTDELITKGPLVFSEMQDESVRDEQCSPLVNKVKRYVQENYRDPQLRLSRFADESNVSLSTLSRLFKKETGVTFMEYLIDYRIRCSIDLLDNTGLRIVEIAEQVGYSSQHYYCDAFKNVMGISPSKYRSRGKAE